MATDGQSNKIIEIECEELGQIQVSFKFSTKLQRCSGRLDPSSKISADQQLCCMNTVILDDRELALLEGILKIPGVTFVNISLHFARIEIDVKLSERKKIMDIVGGKFKVAFPEATINVKKFDRV